MVNEKNIPEPPKFSLDDLPEPPKLEPDSKKENSLDYNKKIDIPAPDSKKISEPNKIDKTKKNDMPPLIFPIKEEKEDFPKPPVDFEKHDMSDLSDNKKNSLDDLPEPPKLEETNNSKPKKKGLFAGLFGKKQPKKQEEIKLDTLPIMPSPMNDIPELPKTEKEDNLIPELPYIEEPKESDFMPSSDLTSDENPEWLQEGEDYIENEMEEEVVKSREDEMLQEANDFLEKEAKTPLSDVKGVGPATETKLKKAGIKTAEHLALSDHKKISEKIKIPESSAKQIISHANKITKIKSRLKQSQKSENISDIIKKLDQERKAVEKIKKSKSINENKLMQTQNHKEIIEVLEKLEKKRTELTSMQQELENKEDTIKNHDHNYRRDLEYIDNLKRRLDHDIRERTQHLINLEKEYFERAQKLAKQQSDVEVKEKTLSEKESFLKQRETDARRKINDLEDRELTIGTKEKKLTAMMNDLEKQDLVLKEKEEDLIKRESEYLKKLDILETHEKSILKNLEEKRISLDKKDKEIKLRESRLHQTQRNVDKQEVAVEFAKNVMEEQKSKLIDDEFEQYLHDELNKINGGITRSDIDIVSNLSIPGLEKQSRSIYQLINQCKDMLSKNKVSEAKVYYNQVRDRYYQGGFSGKQEKESIHNMIRSLYDEINLADIGR